ncbi:unnamed protein product [Linum tenue]|uniref:Uncharacterized protein n=1 Tax=Linum tenue TaxID=586396 RepID=A0AAV0QAA6_9ROSI|nr:unnamed protein product [Linum tenue]
MSRFRKLYAPFSKPSSPSLIRYINMLM